MSPGISAILLDAGGVLVFPTRELLLPPLAAAGVSLDVGLLERAHYRAMLAQDLAASPPASATWWRQYLAGFVAECGVAEDRCAALAAEIAETTGDHSWANVGSGVTDGLRALAALGLPMGVVSNSDGTVEAVLRRLGICHASDGHEPAAAIEGGGVRVGVVVDSAVVGVSKPDPAIFRIALDALGVPPSRAVLHSATACGTTSPAPWPRACSRSISTRTGSARRQTDTGTSAHWPSWPGSSAALAPWMPDRLGLTGLVPENPGEPGPGLVSAA